MSEDISAIARELRSLREDLRAQAERAAGEQPVENAGNSVIKSLDDLRPSRSSA